MGDFFASDVDALIGDARSIADLTEAMARIAAHLTGGNYELSPGDPVDIVGHLDTVAYAIAYAAEPIALDAAGGLGYLERPIFRHVLELRTDLDRTQQALRDKGASA